MLAANAGLPITGNHPMKSSNRDNAEGKLSQGKGKLKETAGEITGDSELAAEGEADQVKGKAQEKVGQVKKVFGK
jgi:uncharacterized protein YjbJ (UPF0337 family)